MQIYDFMPIAVSVYSGHYIFLEHQHVIRPNGLSQHLILTSKDTSR